MGTISALSLEKCYVEAPCSLWKVLSSLSMKLWWRKRLYSKVRGTTFLFLWSGGSLSSTPFFALEDLVDEARRDLEMICWGDMATKDNKMSFVEEVVRGGSLALILKDGSLTNLHLYHNGFEVDN